MKQNNEEENGKNYLSLGISLGMLFGISVGKVIFGNIAIGISISTLIGVAIGLYLENKDKNKEK